MDPLVVAVGGVLVVVAVSALASRLRVAAPLLLVVVGVAISLLPAMPAVQIEPEWILAGVLPPLLYSAAINTPTMDFRRDLATISGLSIGLVLVSTTVVGLAITALVPGIGVATGLALGAIVSPTDAVATAIVRSSRVSPRLATILEGESMLNDASALVLLRSAIAATAATVSLWGVAGDFLRAVLIAAAIGWAVGRVNLLVRARVQPASAGVAVSLVAPFVAYLPTERLGASGLVAAVVAGLVTGQGAPRRLRPEDRMTERAVWRTLELLLESAVFLVMGLELWGLLVDVRSAHGSLTGALVVGVVVGALVLAIRAAFIAPSLVLLRRRLRRSPAIRERLTAMHEALSDPATAALVAATGRGPDGERGGGPGGVRAAVRGGPGGGRPRPARDKVRNRQRERDPERFADRARRSTERLLSYVRRRQADLDYLAAEAFNWRHGVVLVWAGMRGAVTLAAAQSLPAGTPQRSFLVLVAFVVAAGTLMLQGGTLPWVVRRLGVAREDDDPRERADADALRAELVRAVLDRLTDPALVRPDGRPYGAAALDEALARAATAARQAGPMPDEEARAAGLDARAEQQDLRLEVITTQRAALLEMRADGVHGSEALDAALRALDAEEIGLELRASS